MEKELKTAIQKKTVSFYTMGCRLNFSESGSISRGFQERGFDIVDFETPADVVFINTCTVTDGADSSCRNLIRKAHKTSPEGKVVVAGCYAQMESEAISEMQGVDLILGNSEKYKVFEYLDEIGEEEKLVKVGKSVDFNFGATSDGLDQTRAFLKIQDGCNYVCSFCIIPQARGRSRAITIRDALSEANRIVGEGYKEIVLTGVNIGEFEAASGERLADLVRELLDIEGLERLRLSSVEPNTFTDELLEVLSSSEKSMDHFHIPLQSGDDEILKAMKRKYSVSDYKLIIDKIVSYFPRASFGADVICGFPGETNEQFKNTKKLLEELPMTHFHVFPYSQRKNTVAAKMEDHIQHYVKKDRVNQLIELGKYKKAMYAGRQINTSGRVLFEREISSGIWEGHSSHYLKVRVESSANLKNKNLPVYFNNALEGELTGDILS